jgi:DNA-binding CsgD family transcriptional regulator/tetratricopeptide (TPR) repeat protein
MVFAGRGREVSELRAALGGGSRLVLVAGDAGVGKTRFVTEGLRGTLSVWGACLPLTEKLPFLPVAEALDALSRLDDGALLAGALAAIPPYAQAAAARLLPHLQPADATPGTRSMGGQRERILSGVAELLAAVARRSGLAVVIEDLHWADAATLDFLTFLARTGRADAVTVVATVRSDETPLEPAVSRWLAYARGSGHATEIRLAPLTRDEMAEQAAGLTGGQPPVDTDELYARGEGNPFFTEQLVAEALAGAGRPATGPGEGRRGGLPARLAELLTARVSDCGAQAWAALAAMSVAGRALTEDQLTDVTGLDAEALRAGLRELESRSLAETAADGRHRARHALLAEAAAAHLLPGERRGLHERLAAVLQAGGEALAGEAADHWAAAGRGPEELRARLTAARAAERVSGYAEAAAHWQRAIELDQGDAGADLPGWYVRAIDARHLAGDAEGAGVLAEEAYRRFAGHPDPAIAAVVRERAARFRGIGDVFLGGPSAAGSGIPLITEALALFDQAPPSAEHAEALYYYGHYLFSGEGNHEEGIRAVRRGLAIAEAARATALIPRMQPLLAYHLFLGGHLDEGFAVLRRGRALAESEGDAEACLLIDVYESEALLKTARVGPAAEVAVRGLANARQAGLEAFWTTAILAANGAEALLHQGRTADAVAFIGPLTDGPASRDTWLAHVYRAEADLLSGNMAAAAARQEQIAAIVGQVGNADWSREAALRAAELRLWAGTPDQVLPAIHQVLAELKSPRQAIFCGPVLTAGMRACADLAERARARQDEAAESAALASGADLTDRAARLPADPFAGHPSGGHPFAATIPAEHASWEAEQTRLAGSKGPAGSGDPAAWPAAAKAWEGFGFPHRAGYAWWRCAQVRLSAGQDAGGALRAAAGLAAEHAPLLAEIRKLALRARISLPGQIAQPAGEGPRAAGNYGLTSREVLVLRLLAAGRTNAQIGTELFISPKTASVHVSNILRKLGVSGRAQAAATAERAGLLDGIRE